jgi:hypothetical protein
LTSVNCSIQGTGDESSILGVALICSGPSTDGYQSRIVVLRETSVDVLPRMGDEMQTALRQDMRFAEIFELNVGIFKLKYSMNFLMNLTQNGRFTDGGEGKH